MIEMGRSALEQFWLADDLVFLNHGSFGACPREVLAAQDHWRVRFETSPIHFVLEELGGLLRQRAELLGQHIGARGEDLVFVENATTGVNTAIQAAGIQPGDEVVLLDHAYPAVVHAAQHACSTVGARLVHASLPFPCPGPEAAFEVLEKALSPATRLVIIDHVTSASGLVLSLAGLIQRCREQGVLVCVDGAHAPGMLPLDLEGVGADWYTGNCHKWLWAPKGCAFLWTRPERQAQTHPRVISLGYGQGYTAEFDWTGTRDFSAWLALEAALGFHERIGADRIRKHNHDLVMWGAQHLARTWSVELPAPESMIGSLVTLPLPVLGEASVERGLEIRRKLYEQHRVEVPVHPIGDRLWVRISAQIYNEQEDYRVLAERLPSVL
ncbi:MAG: aminotransferase class V-fold PLP-dependent enzyme [Myxococcota bacterium]|nr:aminotransferase class V-fold PLP-dependent enzyme [Myxococcota bacterium]